jgi:Holliday junction resolvasome RuvABC ATP-dependent DNA helicase subunit
MAKYITEDGILQKIYGQKTIVRKFRRYAKISEISMQNKENLNVLLSARTGMGKTTLAGYYIALLCSENPYPWYKWTPSKTDQSIESLLLARKDIKYIFIDECHNIENPGWLLRFLDSKDRIFIMATNLAGLLDPVLLNGRLLIESLEEYADNDLIRMAKNTLRSKVDPIYFPWILKAGKRNPRRIISQICREINIFSDRLKTDQDFSELLNITGYDRNGLNSEERLYLRSLKQHGIAGLQTLSTLTGISSITIENLIEPDLIASGIVGRTSKGRILIDQNIV